MTSTTEEKTGFRTKRLFFALLPDCQTTTALLKWQTVIPGRKTPVQNLHLTLFFLGNQLENKVSELARFMDQSDFSPFELVIDRIGYFPKIRLLWAGPSRTPLPLASLYDTAHRFLIPAYRNEKKDIFRPHVTLARNAPLFQAEIEPPVHWRVTRFALMESVLCNEPGKPAVYRILHEISR